MVRVYTKITKKLKHTGISQIGSSQLKILETTNEAVCLRRVGHRTAAMLKTVQYGVSAMASGCQHGRTVNKGIRSKHDEDDQELNNSIRKSV